LAGANRPVTRHQVLPLNPDTRFCRLIPTPGFAA
jgi:hypothetical protein